ncbi:hypothetical protein BJV74DRAFT_261466 [Russula compacta]|nr:hypothetical protein BJV74DRAFT_261466 [Russula compacta]
MKQLVRPSWADLPHVFDPAAWITFHSRHYDSSFCLPVTLFIFTSGRLTIMDTFHPRRWSLASRQRPASKRFISSSCPINLAPALQVDDRHRSYVLSSPLSPTLLSSASVNTRRTSSTESTPIGSVPSIYLTSANFLLTFHNSASSSVVQKHSAHSMSQMWPLKIVALGSNFPNKCWEILVRGSVCQSRASG